MPVLTEVMRLGSKMSCQLTELRQGWVVILATILQLALPFNVLLNNKILFAGKYSDANVGQQVTDNTVFIVFMNVVSVMVGPVVNVTSHRFVATFATGSAVIGLLISGFADQDSSFLVTLGYGVLIGIGTGVSTVNNILIVYKNFKETVSLAFGIALTGVCLVGIAVPYLLVGLKSYFNNVETMTCPIMVYLGMSCVGFIGAFLMKEKESRDDNDEEDAREVTKTFLENPEVNGVETSIHSETEEVIAVESDIKGGAVAKLNVNEEGKVENETNIENTKDLDSDKKKARQFYRSRTAISSYSCSDLGEVCKQMVVYWTLLKDPVFIVTAVVNSICFSMGIFFISQLDYIARDLLTQSEDSVRSPVMTVLTTAEAIVTLPMGLLGDRIPSFQYPRKTLYMVCCLGMSATMLASTTTTSMTQFYVVTVFVAVFKAGLQIYTNLVYVDCYPRTLHAAIGLSNLFRCVATLALISPVFSHLLILCPDFTCPTYFLAGTTCLGMVVWTCLTVLGCRQEEREQQIEPAGGT